MQGILLLLPGNGGVIPGARELREAGFMLSTALASAGGEPDRVPDPAVEDEEGGNGETPSGGPTTFGEEGGPPEETYDSPARRMTSAHISDRLKG